MLDLRGFESGSGSPPQVGCYHCAMSTIFRITLSFDNQDQLRALGPVIPAAWSTALPTSASAKQVRGNVLLDTGATHIFVDESVPRQLGLSEGPRQEANGLGGKQLLATYDLTLLLPVEAAVQIPSAPKGSQVTIGFPWKGVQAVSGLSQRVALEGQRCPNGLPVIGILGRVILQFAKVTYDGLSGKVIIDLDETIQYPKG